jgi:hypothetical protein
MDFNNQMNNEEETDLTVWVVAGLAALTSGIATWFWTKSEEDRDLAAKLHEQAAAAERGSEEQQACQESARKLFQLAKNCKQLNGDDSCGEDS